ncbi:MAG: BREX system P-loop protein BrxC [Thermodesulfobacteriota bacterium]
MMEKIRSLFDPSKDIYRTIEKVITYEAAQEHRLKSEISEYIVTESIEDQFEKLLTKMQAAMEAGGENEVGVWVSGFYGSGKSSFTKYLGLAFDERVQVEGVPFLKHFQNRLNRPTTKALFAAVVKRFPAAVIFLDLAAEMLAGATMVEVSTVLFYKVLQFAGYSRNLKIAAFERKLQKDGRYEEFKQKIKNDLGVTWSEVQNDPLVVDSMIPDIAHQMYPELFRTPTSFSTATSDFVQFENERVKEMLDIVRDATGKPYILFVIDEVGQYVAARQNLILNLDGLAKNLKQLGNGRVWIIGTAQQTLTEDDPRATLNSPALYKLKDRFPIQVDLESSDIKDICVRRLLGKSPEGKTLLGNLFDQHGQQLRYNTKLQDAKYYDSDFNRDTFINLYPFLPAHFDILLHLLGALAKSTGGLGLRSAIKVIQDILIEGVKKQVPVVEQPIGWLATTVTLFDTLERDIRRAFPSIHGAVAKALGCFRDSPIHQEVAKTVAVLQILGNLPVTIHNVASLMHPAVTGASRRDEVERAVHDLINEPLVPFGEQEGSLCFFSEKLNDIEQERAQIPVRSIESRRIFNDSLVEVFNPLPAIRVNGGLAVKSGIKVQTGGFVGSLAGERETIQTVVEFAAPSDYETVRARLVDDSRTRSAQYTVYLLGRTHADMDERVSEIYRCREICNRYRTDPDREVKQYCAGQMDRAVKLANNLQQLIKQSLAKGSFVFRGQTTAVDTLDEDLLEAWKKHLSTVAGQVFDRYAEAPVRADTTLAERFLRARNLAAVTSEIDPLGIVQIVAGTPSVRNDHKALLSIRDYVDRNGTVEGKRLIEHFTSAPFGWSQDTLRYLVAGLLVAGEIKLKVSGREVTASGQQAIDALKTNNAFKTVGVALREGRPSMETLARASERLTELTGDTVVPLEPEISKAAVKHLLQLQIRFATLGEKLDALALPGAERVQLLNKDIADVLFTDGSDAPQRMGAEESSLYENLKWAAAVDLAFGQGMEGTIKTLRKAIADIRALPGSGVPGDLKDTLLEQISMVEHLLGSEDFYQHANDLNGALTTIEAQARNAAERLAKEQQGRLQREEQALCALPEWNELTQEEQAGVLEQVDRLRMDASPDLEGLKDLVRQEFIINTTLMELRERIVAMGEERNREREQEHRAKAREEGVFLKTVKLPKRVVSLQDLNALLQALEALRTDALKHDKVEIHFELEPTSE